MGKSHWEGQQGSAKQGSAKLQWDPTWKPLISELGSLPPMGWRGPGEGETGFQPLIPDAPPIVPFGWYKSDVGGTGPIGEEEGEEKGPTTDMPDWLGDIVEGLSPATQAGMGPVWEAMERSTTEGRMDVAGAERERQQYEQDARRRMAGAEERHRGLMEDLGGIDEFGQTILGDMETAMGVLERARTDIRDIPDRLRGDIQLGRERIDQQLIRAERLIGADRTEALGAVHLGYANMLSTATADAHAAQGQNDSKINALVQQGQLGSDQAAMMKMQFNLGSNMNIAQSIGAVGAQYGAMAQKTYADFGNMLTSIEGAAVGAAATYEATGVGALTSAEVGLGNMNVQIAEAMANVQTKRMTSMLMLGELRTAAEASFNQYELAMLPEMNQPFVPASVVEYNDVIMKQEWMRSIIGAEQGTMYMELVERMGVQQTIFSGIDMFMSCAQNWGGG